MSVSKWIWSGVAAMMVVGLSTSAFAQQYRPFTPVENVCPDCEQPKADVIALSDGSSVRGTVVAENTDFYVVVRYGEVRAVPRGQVQSIKWADGSKPSSLMGKDQILLNSDHVLSGTIIDEKDEPAVFQIKSSFSDYTYTVAKSQVKKAYKGGSAYTFSTGVE